MSRPASFLLSPERLAALRSTGLLDSPPEPAFDRLTRLATRLLDAPVALVCLVDRERQFFKSQCGLPEPWASRREMPLAYSFCRHALGSPEPLAIGDARRHPLAQDSPAVSEAGFVAYLGAPLVVRDQPLGTLCVVDSRPRQWSPAEAEALRDLAASAVAEIQLRLSERAARDALERHALVQRATNDVVWDWEVAADAVVWSAALCTTFGYAPAEVLPEPDWWSSRVHPEDRGRVLEGLAAALRGESDDWCDEYRFRRADGGYAVVLDRGYVQRGADGGALRMIGSMQDVTAQRGVQEELREANQMLRALIQSSPLAIMAMDPEGRITLWNPASERLFGWTEAEALGLPLRIVPPEGREEHRGLRERVRAGETLVDREVVRRRRDGSAVQVSISAAPIRDGAGRVRGLIATCTDVSERVEARRQLERYSRELERSNQDLQDFAYVASHDLQEPLRKVQAFGELLAQDAGAALGEQARDYLRRMQGSALRMRGLIDGLLAYSRVGTEPREMVPVALREVAEEAVSDLFVPLREAGGEVRIGELPTVTADAAQMRQLLQNLVSNALKFRRPDVPPRVEIGATAPPGAPLVEVWVDDNGIGFEMEQAERIFAPFERLHGRAFYEGTGIGLAICRRIVERHGGTLCARSVPGQGSRFTFSLPVTARQEAA